MDSKQMAAGTVCSTEKIIWRIVMKTTKRGVLFGMVGMMLVMGLVLAGCKQTYEVADMGTGKTATITLKKSSYKLEYDGHTAEGDATREKSGSTKGWVWTDGGMGGAVVDSKKLITLTHASNDGTWGIIWTGSQSKKSIDGDDVDVELILLDDDDDD
jgi:hypothetical protein